MNIGRVQARSATLEIEELQGKLKQLEAKPMEMAARSFPLRRLPGSFVSVLDNDMSFVELADDVSVRPRFAAERRLERERERERASANCRAKTLTMRSRMDRSEQNIVYYTTAGSPLLGAHSPLGAPATTTV